MKHLNYLNLNYFATTITTVSTDKMSGQQSSNSKALVTHWNICKLANDSPQKSVTIFSVSFELANSNVKFLPGPKSVRKNRNVSTAVLQTELSGESPPNLL